MTTTTEPVTVQHRAGKCPACGCPVWGEVRVSAEVGDPWLNDEGKAIVHASPVLLGAAFTHRCERADDCDEWEV